MSSTLAHGTGVFAVDDERLKSSFASCRQLTRVRARNFYYGMMLTPEPKRSAMYAVYTWMRTVDDLADEPARLPHDEQTRSPRIELFRRLTMASLDPNCDISPVSGDPQQAELWPAVRKTLVDYHIDAGVLGDMIDGQLVDQHKSTYATFADLYRYCYQVASVVGLVCIQVWGYKGGEETRRLAEHRGIALQLTNILRDLVEDARRGRVYVPTDELARYGYDATTFAESVQSGQADERFDRLMAMQIDRARSLYEKSESLDRFITRSCRPTCWAIMKIYRDLLERIARDPRRVLCGTVALSRGHKLSIALRATLRRSLHR